MAGSARRFRNFSWRVMHRKNYPLSAQILTTSTYVCSLLNRLLLFVPTAIFLFLCCLLIFNISRGFDITDESFSLLWASQPEHVQASATQFGYYTKFLYILSGQNIAVFRSLGILVLLGAAGFFSVALERYWMSLSGSVLHAGLKWEVIPFILLCTLAYYRSWQLVPSYNWLALCCILLVAAGLLNAAAREVNALEQSGFDIGLLINAVFVGIGGGLAFMAKPTTALVLAVTALFWVTIHYTKLRKLWIPFLAFAVIMACLVLLTHAFVFMGGIIPFYADLRDGMNLGNILVGGRSIGTLFFQAIEDMKQVPARVFTLSSTGFFIFPFVLLVVRWSKGRGRETIAIHLLSLFLVLFFVTVYYRLWDTGHFSKTGMGFTGVALASVAVSSAVLTRFALNRKDSRFAGRSFPAVAALCFFLFMLAAAFSFGSNNGFMRQLSWAYVFLTAGTLYTAFWIDQYAGRKILGNIVPSLIAVSVLLVFIDALNQPFRLPNAISDQNVKIAFLAGNGSLYVDKKTAEYIHELQKVAGEAGWSPGTPLIDLTGGSPGAIVILGGRITGIPWLLGSYKGSNEFAKTALGMVPESEQRSAWVLTAPKGRRKISSEILVELGLDFPNSYARVGKVKTGHRNEIQILWKPIDEGGTVPSILIRETPSTDPAV